jgi:CheY-like chemotaxis protein
MSTSPRYPVVMLIDDNELDNFVNKKLIENEHFAGTVQIQPSAVNALDFLNKNSGGTEIPDLIFLDIMMPIMDGFGFLDEFEKLKDDVKKKSKIIMLSTSESFKDLNRANKNKYVYKFLNKPLSKSVLDALNV